MATATAGRSAFRVIERYPLAFGAGVSCVKTSGSDLLVQKVIEQREEIDWKRNIAFGTFGLLYLGGVQYALYVNVFQRIFPRAASFAAKPFAQKIKDVKGVGTMFGQVRKSNDTGSFNVEVQASHPSQNHSQLIGHPRSMCSSSSFILSRLLHDERNCYEQWQS